MFDAKVEQLNHKLRTVHEWTTLISYRDIMGTVHSFHDEVDDLEKMKQEIATEENLLHGYKFDFGHLQNLVRFFEPYYELWTRIDDMMTKKKKWQDSKLCDINADDVIQMHKESEKSLNKLQKDLSLIKGNVSDKDKELQSKIYINFVKKFVKKIKKLIKNSNK